MRTHHHIAIVGGGFSGTALAIHLLRCGDSRLEISLIEAGDRLGRGVAYGTSLDEHVLNTRAGQMSLLPDEPDHFVSWLRRGDEHATGQDFVSRRRYGDYVEETLLDALGEAGRLGQIFRAHTRVRATDVCPHGDGFIVELDNGCRLLAQSVVLTVGHPRPADPLAEYLSPWTSRYLRDPWQRDLAADVLPEDRVLILGTGLTMVDAVLTLLRRGHRGPIHALSRNGLLPRPHRARVEPLPSELRQRLVARTRGRTDARKLSKEIRAIVREAAEQGISWHAVFDALRPVVPGIWSSLEDRERARFLRRLRPFWEVHRHRIAPEPARAIGQLMRQGRLEVRAGRVVGAEDRGSAIEVTQSLRGERAKTERYEWIINCTGPSYQPASRTPFDRRLVERGLLKSDRLGLGYRTSPSGAVIGRRGLVPGLHVLGPACRPVAWESTSVPELRDHAEALAARIVGERRSAWHPLRRRA